MNFFTVEENREEKIVNRHYHFFRDVSSEAFCFCVVAVVLGFLIFSIAKAIQSNNTEMNNVELNRVQKMDPQSQCQHDLDICKFELKTSGRVR